MSTCTCIHCTGEDYHRKQMLFEEMTKDDYMENRPPSVYEKLEELNEWTMSRTQNELMKDIMDAVNAIDNELISLALELPPEQAEKLLAIQERLY